MQATIQHKPFIMLGAAALIFCSAMAYRALQPTLTPSTEVTVRQQSAPQVKDEIERLQQRLKANPDDANTYAQLGMLMLARVRETAEPQLYVQAEQAFHEALKREPNQVDALIGLGSLALSRHAFAEAITWGEKARAINPYRAQILGVIGDAQVELGRYDDATATIQKMVDTRPDIASYSRVSYVRELHGDVDGAIDAMTRAARAGSPGAEATLWSQTYVGHLYFNQGNLDTAAQIYSGVLAQQPGYPYAMGGLARVRAAQGRTDEAITLYQSILNRIPLPQYAIELGELYDSLGKSNEAQAQLDLVRAIQQLNATADMNTDLEMALFEADHGDTARAVELARAAYAKRPSIHAADALAWALYRNGDAAQAQKYAREALKLGTKDALMHFHAGMIAQEIDKVQAQKHLRMAIDLNPYFSIRYAPFAHDVLKSLEQP
jgi:tetratricopeptide (TPR) repeat protein